MSGSRSGRGSRPANPAGMAATLASTLTMTDGYPRGGTPYTSCSWTSREGG